MPPLGTMEEFDSDFSIPDAARPFFEDSLEIPSDFDTLGDASAPENLILQQDFQLLCNTCLGIIVRLVDGDDSAALSTEYANELRSGVSLLQKMLDKIPDGEHIEHPSIGVQTSPWTMSVEVYVQTEDRVDDHRPFTPIPMFDPWDHVDDPGVSPLTPIPTSDPWDRVDDPGVSPLTDLDYQAPDVLSQPLPHSRRSFTPVPTSCPWEIELTIDSPLVGSKRDSRSFTPVPTSDPWEIELTIDSPLVGSKRDSRSFTPVPTSDPWEIELTIDSPLVGSKRDSRSFTPVPTSDPWEIELTIDSPLVRSKRDSRSFTPFSAIDSPLPGNNATHFF
ncbi:hypothetical protein BKA93DRAFT_927800 [Sparassis latifolia]